MSRTRARERISGLKNILLDVPGASVVGVTPADQDTRDAVWQGLQTSLPLQSPTFDAQATSSVALTGGAVASVHTNYNHPGAADLGDYGAVLVAVSVIATITGSPSYPADFTNTVTYGGVTMTKLVGKYHLLGGTEWSFTEIYGLQDPPTRTQAVDVTVAQATSTRTALLVASATYTDVDSFGTTASNDGVGTPGTLSVSSAIDHRAFVAFGGGAGNGGAFTSFSQTARSAVSNGSGGLATGDAAGAGTVAFSVTAPSYEWEAVGVDLVGAPTGATGHTTSEIVTDLSALVSLVASKQDGDSDLTAIAGLTPSNDDIIQRKSGAWTNRTLAQYKADLALNNVDNTSDATKNAASVTLTNKTIDLASNTLTGTKAQFNTALSGDDFVTLTGTETLTNKTLTSPGISAPTINGGFISGILSSLVQFAMYNGSFYSLLTSTATSSQVLNLPNNTATDTLTANATTATLTNKTVNLSSNTLTGTKAQFDTACSDGDFEYVGNKGQANGYASLDGGGKVPITQLPSSLMEYQGVWNASTNSPTLADGTGSAGDVYRVGTGASRDLGSGSITFDVGDYVIYNGSTWEKSDTTDAVASVAGLTGVISSSGLKTALSLDNVDNTSDATKNSASVTLTNKTVNLSSNTLTGTKAQFNTACSDGDFIFDGGALGTPSSGTLTNCTSLPISGLTASTSTALGVGSVELGHASDTTLSRSSAGVLAVEGVVVPTISSTSTLTNKTISGSSNTLSNIAIASLSATGTQDSSHYLRGDGTWSTLPVNTYSATIGDGSTTAIAVTHGLGTRSVVVACQDHTTHEIVYPDVVATSTSVVTLTFATAPATNGMDVTVIAGSQTTMPDTNTWQAYDSGLIAMSFDYVAQYSSIRMINNYMYVATLPVRAATTITNVVLPILALASGTSGQNFVALYQGGTLLASSADQTSNWGTDGLKTIALSSPQAVTAGYIQVGVVCNASTPIALGSSINLVSSIVDFNGAFASAPGGKRFGFHAGHTSAPGTMPTLSTNAMNFLVGVS